MNASACTSRRRECCRPTRAEWLYAETLNGALIQSPNRIKHRVIVRVEDVLLELGVAGDMNLRDAFGRNAVDVIDGSKS